MKYPAATKALLLLAICILCGVTPAPSGDKTDSKKTKPERVPDPGLRNNCASLLYDLLKDERHLNWLLIVKRESDELERLVKEISVMAGDGVKKLEQLARADKSLDLQTTALPAGEAATREAVAETKQSELLQAKGDEFEFKVLLTQVEALNYGAHLAKVAAENEANPERAREFFALSDQQKKLFEQTVAQLRQALRANSAPQRGI